MQIDWSKAPEWAMWHAFDECGIGWWFSHKPKKFDSCFYFENREFNQEYCLSNYNFNVKYLTHWENTLEQRPSNKPGYTAQLLAIVEQQKAKGLAKYGVALEDANLSALELVEHAIEEVTDQTFYLLALRDKLRKDVE